MGKKCVAAALVFFTFLLWFSPLPAATLIGAEAPSSFRNVTWSLQDGVIPVENKLSLSALSSNLKMRGEIENSTSVQMSAAEKLKQGALIRADDVQKLTGAEGRLTPAGNSPKVLFDPVNKTALKLMNPISIKGTEYIEVERPQLHEVLKNFVIPRQQITLTRGNITSFAPGVEECIVTRNRTALSFLGTPTARASEYGSHLRNPWLELEFRNKQLTAYTPAGQSISITVDGYLGLDSITVDGEYSGFGGYRFVASTGEEIHLKVTSTINAKELLIPLFGLDIPAGIARVSGGLFLVVGTDGSFTLVVEAEQWLTVSAGLRGSTFMYLPTSFHPIFSCDKGFNADARFAGSVNGSIKVGPLLRLELLDWELVGAGAMIGVGLACSTSGSGSDSVINAEIYGLLQVYATLLDHTIYLVNGKLTLCKFQKPNTAGYDIVYREACAYRGVIWGNIRRDMGAAGFQPYNGSVRLEIRRNNRIIATYNAYCNASGDFSIRNLSLFKGDIIRVVRVGSQAVNSASINPTLPFREVKLFYADFFDDSAKGQVPPARVKNWSTGNYEWINYRGEIVFSNGKKTNTDPNGNFALSHDFKPDQKISASLSYRGFTVTSNVVTADAELAGKRLIEYVEASSSRDANGITRGRRIEREYYLIYNMRGSKAVNQSAVYTARHYLLSKPFYWTLPGTGRRYQFAKLLQEKSYSVPAVPLGSGCSRCALECTTEWTWPVTAVEIKKPLAAMETPSAIQQLSPLNSAGTAPAQQNSVNTGSAGTSSPETSGSSSSSSQSNQGSSGSLLPSQPLTPLFPSSIQPGSSYLRNMSFSGRGCDTGTALYRTAAIAFPSLKTGSLNYSNIVFKYQSSYDLSNLSQLQESLEETLRPGLLFGFSPRQLEAIIRSPEAIKRTGELTITYEGKAIAIRDLNEEGEQDGGGSRPARAGVTNPLDLKFIEKVLSRINPADTFLNPAERVESRGQTAR